MTRWLAFCAAVTFLACLCTPGAAAEAGAKKKLLYITATAGFHHDACEKSIPCFEQMAKDAGLEVTFSDKVDPITAENLKGFDAVIFSNTSGNLPASMENREALIDFVKGGKAFVGIHAATDSWGDWEPYYDMLGGTFNGHPWSKEITIDVEDPGHPSAAHLPSPWKVNDEIYTFKNYSRDKLHVILSMDVSLEQEKGNREDRDYALAWCKPHGEGRVFYTALGHNEEVWKDPAFQKHLVEGILWTLKVEPKGTHPLSIGHKKPGGWVPLFDGKTLAFGTDWETSGDPAVTRKHWTVQPGGILQGDSRNLPGTESSHLYYIKKKFKNFEYKADVNINRDGNSGMYFRCVDRNRDEKGIWQDWPNGYEAQVNLGSPHDPKRS